MAVADRTPNIVSRINSTYYELTASEKKVADYVVDKTDTAPHQSISQVAEACGVADATVSRFCRKLGCHDYSEFKLAMAEYASLSGRVTNGPLTGEVTPDDSIEVMSRKLYQSEVDAIGQTASMIEPTKIRRAADILLAADQVLCMGQGGSMIMAEEAAHLFTTTYQNFFAISDDHLQISRAAIASPGDVILYFSYSGATRELMDIIPIAHGRGMIIILVTRFPNSPGAQQVDLVLQCGSNESALQLGSAEARIAQIYLLDIIHTEMCRHDMERIRERKQAVLDALSCKHI